MDGRGIKRRLLHLGCGMAEAPPWLRDHHETRVDVDPAIPCDIHADVRDLGYIGQYDVTYCCHMLEHLYPYDVDVALKEMLRVLRPGGFAMIIVPDLEGISPTHEQVYECPDGPVTGHDMFYGYNGNIQLNEYMAHHTGFVESTMSTVLETAGFSRHKTARLPSFNLLGVGVK